MLTPRRTLLLLAGFVLFAGAYLLYARLLGWLDGLPQLPAAMLIPNPGTFAPPPRDVSPTQLKIIQAFGENSPEAVSSHYEMKLDFMNGQSSLVLAAGKLPSNPGSRRVTLTPFSLAVFSKPKPLHLRQPGEVTEISTLHADKGVLVFDREVNNLADMKKAKLLGLELISDFDQGLRDPRAGVVHITNNQKSNDLNRALVLRTVGPMFYRDAKATAGTPAADGPDFWTDAPVEIVDRQNLPRPVGAAAPLTAPAKGEDSRNTTAVAAILGGHRLPPPTVTAIGLRVYLEPDPPPGQKKKEPKPGGSAVNGLRRVEFLEQVVMNLWVQNSQSLVGGAASEPAKADAPRGSGMNLVPPPGALAWLAGNAGVAAYNFRLMDRALLQIDTRGPFAYDAEKSLARFDVVPQSDPNLPNDVQVTKVPARGGTSSLFSQVLELEFNGGPTGAKPANTPAIKKLHAWTSTRGRDVTLASEEEATVAVGQDLVHDQGASRTVLTGAPLHVVRELNSLTAGAPQVPATLTTEPAPQQPGAPPGPRKSQVTVRGAGEVKLFDAASNAVTLTATWKTSLVQSKEVISGREQDLFVFTDDAKFDDKKADYWLSGKVLKLWLTPRAEPTAGTKAASGGPPKPARLQALGQVRSHSTEYDIDDGDQLTVHISDALPPAPSPTESAAAAGGAVAGGVNGVGPRPIAPAGPMAAVPSVAPPVPPKPPEPVAKGPAKPPYKIRAKTIETFVTRTAVAPPPAKPGETAPPAGAKYQLDRARCEDSVSVKQDPLDPTKPRGVDILGRLLLIDGSADGSVMTVFGWPDKLGEVHQEEMSLLGPKVVLNQVLNAASVEGRGALTMPTGSTIAGSELKQPEVVVVQWRDAMAFDGARKSATFVGKVQATQGESWVLCHTMNVVFDRPLYFNPAQKKAEAAKPADPKAPPGDGKGAKIDKVFCYPAPADTADDKRELDVLYHQVEYDTSGKMSKAQRLRAQELTMEAQARDEGGGDPYQRVVAHGPGTLHIWQQGEANVAGPPAGAPRPPVPKPPAKKDEKEKDEQEMKLTVVRFSGRMVGVDKGKVFQQATFTDSVEAISAPADSPTVQFEKHKLPPRAVLLTCNKELVVWSHKKPDGVAEQHMDARGNAYVRTDDYDGSGEKINSAGKTVMLYGSEAIPARITQRFGQGNDQVGEVITYDRAAGRARVDKGFGGTIGNPPKK